jgi:hypothetical protein
MFCMNSQKNSINFKDSFKQRDYGRNAKIVTSQVRFLRYRNLFYLYKI